MIVIRKRIQSIVIGIYNLYVYLHGNEIYTENGAKKYQAFCNSHNHTQKQNVGLYLNDFL